MNWDQLTSPEIDALDRSIPVILPVAAIEQHGLHLPLATDRMIVEYFCQQLNEAIPDQVLILPVMSVGCSEHHMEFTGSLTLKHDTFQQQAEDILGSVVVHGFKNLIIYNSHGGNLGISQVIVEPTEEAAVSHLSLLVAEEMQSIRAFGDEVRFAPEDNDWESGTAFGMLVHRDALAGFVLVGRLGNRLYAIRVHGVALEVDEIRDDLALPLRAAMTGYQP